MVKAQKIKENPEIIPTVRKCNITAAGYIQLQPKNKQHFKQHSVK